MTEPHMGSIQRLMIANRGEIAVPIQRACRSLGITSIQLFSEADCDARFVAEADECLCIGPPPASKSYLNIERIVAAGKLLRVDAIHPGYGFLSENAAFALKLEEESISFVGPPSQVIAQLGDKVQAKRLMHEMNIPCVPGYAGEALLNPSTLADVSSAIAFPLIVKATAGGGGRGMRVVTRAEELSEAVVTTSEEARLAFGNGTVYFEKYLQAPRHIEFQVLADGVGNAVWLGERVIKR